MTANLVRDADPAGILPLTVDTCARVLDAETSAVMVLDPRGGMRVLSTADDRPILVRLLETHAHDGPWHDSATDQDVVVADDIDRDDRWPGLTADVLAAGYRAIHAIPMILGDQAVGSLSLFYRERAGLAPGHRALAQTLADLTTLSLCQESDDTRYELLARRTLTELDDRVRYEHALGMTAGRLNTDIDQATAILRSQARIRGVPLATLARRITDGTFDWTQLDPPQSQPQRP
ncbi:GAF domain-containing protein [Nocardia miyunensis]|uniref:GAF domain-containing protein n=1 Tax=Nocardia miyunensis TaxID=282684 RepID=UPI000836D6B7|nr:GAF domain-containing protein [Nocardia miyunensis]